MAYIALKPLRVGDKQYCIGEGVAEEFIKNSTRRLIMQGFIAEVPDPEPEKVPDPEPEQVQQQEPEKETKQTKTKNTSRRTTKG